ncbi:MAG: YihY/virulence factor BrkB family protein [Pirellulaceae bacterium]|nr:YihY/virulence factor BrkB family protein [Pirellulaceae bacterium]
MVLDIVKSWMTSQYLFWGRLRDQFKTNSGIERMAFQRSLLKSSKSALTGFFADDCMTLAASLAFYTLFAMPPLIFLLVIVLSTGMRLAVEPEVADAWARTFLQQASNLIGIQSAAVEIGHIIELSRNRPGVWWKSLLSLSGVLLAATGLVTSLQSSLNRVWGVKPVDRTMHFVWKRFASLVLILGFAFLLIVSFVLARTIELLTNQFAAYFSLHNALPSIMNHGVNAITTWACFAAIFRFMPDARVPWRHAATGGLLTFLLFITGQEILYAYLSLGNPAAELGSAAGSLVVVLLWIYYSSCILLLGAELTAAMSNSSSVVPETGAVRVEERIVP